MHYLSIKKGRFVCSKEELGKEVEAVITLAGKRFLRWGSQGVDGQRECHDESKLPHGWSLAYDLDLVVGHALYRFTIYDALVVRDFKPYLAKLASRSLRPSDVLTRITIEPQFRGTPVLCFKAICRVDAST
jgi:hypothetical protein